MQGNRWFKCFKPVEVVDLNDLKNVIIESIVEEVKKQILPELIYSLQMTENNLNNIIVSKE